MPRRKRTDAQLDFDMAKHGWAFCNTAMLETKIAYLETVAKSLASTDKRHQELDNMRIRLKVKRWNNA